jgi:hypothetical protein
MRAYTRPRLRNYAHAEQQSGTGPTGVRDIAREDLQATLTRVLSDRALLLVLDNFEHVLAAAALVSDLVLNSAGVKALVTSRAALRVSDEHELPDQPLGCRPAVEICRRLDGLPLAVELTARATSDAQAAALHLQHPAAASVAPSGDGRADGAIPLNVTADGRPALGA